MEQDLEGPDAMAAAILRARLGNGGLDAARLGRVATDPDAAYIIQALVAERAPAVGLGRVVGYKIGLSTTAAQQHNGIDEPVMGRVYAARLHASGVRLEIDVARRIGVECEIGVRLAADLAPEVGPVDTAQAARAVGSYHPAIELLEDRFARSQEAPLWALAADDMLGMGGIVGAALPGFDPFAAHHGSIVIDGVQRGQGASRDLAGGGPLAGVAWLANRLAAAGLRLGAGDFVLSGGLNAPLWLEPKIGTPTTVSAVIDGVATASVTIAFTQTRSAGGAG